MTSLQILRRFQNRPGFRLADVADVAMPVYSVNIVALTMAHRRVPPIEEFLLRCIAMDMSDIDQLKSYLGLAEEVLRPALATLAQTEHIALTAPNGRNSWRVTGKGRKTLETAELVSPEERTIPIVFDALLRKPVALRTEALLEFRHLAEEGRIEIEVHPPKRPVIEEVSPSDLERLLKKTGGSDGQRRDVLCVRELEQKSIKKRFLPATALLFNSIDGDEVQLAFVIDNRPSEAHENAFASTQSFRTAVDQFRKTKSNDRRELDKFLESVQISQPVGDNLQIAVQELQAEIETVTAQLIETDNTEALQLQLHEAHRRLAELEEENKKLEVRNLYVLDHPPLLQDALRNSATRLLIISPWITKAVVDHDFLRSLETALRRSVEVYLGYGISGEEHTKPIEQNWSLMRLLALSKRYKNFRLVRLGDTHAKILIKDSEYAVVTSFNWLSFRGDPNRTFRDEQGVLIRRPALVDQKFIELAMRFQQKE